MAGSLRLRDAGYRVSAICPMLKGYTREYEELEGIHIYRHRLAGDDAQTAKNYAREYARPSGTRPASPAHLSHPSLPCHPRLQPA